MIALLAAGLAQPSIAHAQTEPSAAAATTPEPQGEIVVTGSRVARAGFESPTPVTGLTAADIQQRAPTTIADTLATIPSFRASSTPQTSGVTTRGGGIVTADLRALGPTRTLVLLDGHRFVPSGSDGVVDLKLIPQLMIGAVEVVTGGASAAYGSDAVAGVVNFKLDTKLRGVRGLVQGGISDYGDAKSIRASIAAGGTAADDRITYLVGGDYSKFYGIGNQYSRPWGRQEVGLITNPLYASNGQPNYIITPGVHPANLSPGGLVISGPLRGLNFLPNGATSNFNFGTTYGTGAASMIGGDNQGNNLSNATRLASPVESATGLAHVDARIADAFQPYVELSYGYTHTKTQSQQPRMTGALALTIPVTNPFLPASTRAAMASAGVSTIQVGRLLNDTGPVLADIANTTMRVLTGVKGDLGGGWAYDVYLQWGENKSKVLAGPNNLITGRFFQAVAGCPGTSAAQGCKPINIFGDGSISVDNYAFGTADFRVTTNQKVLSGSVTGTPFSTWAGPVSIATGIEYRKEQARGTSDPISQLLVPVGTSGQSIAGGFAIGNQVPINGSYDLWEVFGEAVVPLLRDAPLAKSVDFNGAVRRTDYSLSGVATTWKAGLTWQIDSALKIRGTRSRDIRAPNINDLFQFGGSQFSVVFDPVVGSTVQTRFVKSRDQTAKSHRSRDARSRGAWPTFVPALHKMKRAHVRR